MTFAHPFFLLGAGVVALPIILHLIFRKKPKRMVFPAMRFLREAAPKRRRSQKLRSIILLLLRCLLLLFLVLALAKPSVRNRDAVGERRDDSTPCSMVLILETSPRMSYEQNGRSRLDLAKIRASSVVASLREDSEVAVFDGRGGFDAFEVDRDAALDRIDRLVVTPDGREMTSLVEEALYLLRSAKYPNREICVLTDQTDAAWPEDGCERLAGISEFLDPGQRVALSDQNKTPQTTTVEGDGKGEVRLSRIDCGVAHPTNGGFGPITLTPSIAVPYAPVRVDTTLRAVGAEISGNVQLTIAASDPRTVTTSRATTTSKRTNRNRTEYTENAEDIEDTRRARNTGDTLDIEAAQDTRNAETLKEANVAENTAEEVVLAERLANQERSVTLNAGQSEQVAFTIEGLPPGTYQGKITLPGRDPLVADNQRFFTLRVSPPGSVLIVAKDDSHAIFVREALSPGGLDDLSQTRFRSQVVTYEEFTDATFDSGDAEAIFLLDPPQLDGELWKRLQTDVRRGVGLGVFCGQETTAEAFDSPESQEILGVRPLTQVRCGEEPLRLAPTPGEFTHPLLAAFQGHEDRIPWLDLPVFRYWNVESSPGTDVLLRYDDGGAAILERSTVAVVDVTRGTNASGEGVDGGNARGTNVDGVGIGRTSAGGANVGGMNAEGSGNGANARGIVLVMTTPVSDPVSDPNAWNFLPSGEASWVFLILMNQVANRLSQAGIIETPNTEPGASVFLRMIPNTTTDSEGVASNRMGTEGGDTTSRTAFTSCVLTDPEGTTTEIPLEASDGRTLYWGDAMIPGNWTVRAGGSRNGVRTGFSVNLAQDATSLDRIATTDGVSRLDRIAWANVEVLDAIASGESTDGTSGTEDSGGAQAVAAGAKRSSWNGDLFPWAMVLVALFLAGETLLANRFYREASQ